MGGWGGEGRGGWALIPGQNSRRSGGWMLYTFSSRKAERDTRTGTTALAPACRAVACPCMAPGPGGEGDRKEMASTHPLSGKKKKRESTEAKVSHFTIFTRTCTFVFFFIKCSEVELLSRCWCRPFTNTLLAFPVNKPEH